MNREPGISYIGAQEYQSGNRGHAFWNPNTNNILFRTSEFTAARSIWDCIVAYSTQLASYDNARTVRVVFFPLSNQLLKDPARILLECTMGEQHAMCIIYSESRRNPTVTRSPKDIFGLFMNREPGVRHSLTFIEVARYCTRTGGFSLDYSCFT